MKKLTKKTLSVFLAAVMALSALPLAISAFADEARDHYLFAYFTSNSTAGQKIRFAVSEDGLNYNALNKNKAIISQTVGTGCARDPYIFIGQDGKYYIIATDMDATRGWYDNSNTMAVFQSDDLVTWNNQALFDMYEMYKKMGITYVEGQTAVHYTWAPQVIWDSSVNKYMIYFAFDDTEIANSGKQIMYYMYATDLMDVNTWEEPQKLYEATKAAIDGDIMFNSSDNTYYMYYKDESQATICYATASSLTGPYTYQGKAITSVSDALEGCNCFYINGKLTMFCDAYNNGYFVAAQSDDYKNWNVLSSGYNIDQLSPRHGSVINITKTEYDRLVEAYGTSSNDDILYNFNSDLNFSASGANTYEAQTDSSGHTYDTRSWWGSVKSHQDSNWITLNDSCFYINDSSVKSLLTGDDWTISLDQSMYTLRTDSSHNAPMFGIRSGSKTLFYLLDNGDYYYYDNDSSSTVKGGSTTVETGITYRFHLVYTNGALSLYRNGTKLFTKTMPKFVTNDGTAYFSVGACDVSNESWSDTTVSNLRFRNSALSSAAVASEANISSDLIYRYNDGTDSVNDRDNVMYTGDSGIKFPVNYEYNGDSREQSWTVSSWVNPGTVSGGENVLFMMGWDSYVHYLTILENGVIHYNFDGSYTDISATSFSANTWYFVQINFIPRGDSFEINTYVNGSLVNTANSSGGSTNWVNMDVRNKLPDYFFDNNDNFPVTAGVGGAAHDHGGYWNTPGNGYIDDFRVYNRALDPTMLYNKVKQEYKAETAGDDDSAIEQANTIDDALAIFEARIAKMANSGYNVMYTNLSAAYDAYKAAVAAKESGVAGADELSALKEALTNMIIFTPYKGENNPGNGSNFNPEADYYGNIIYSEGATNGAHAYSDNSSAEIYEKHGVNSKYGAWAYLYYPSSVIMYDGENDAVIPVMTGFINKDERWSVDVLSLSDNMDDFDLKDGNWKTYGSYYDNDSLDTGSGDSNTFKWPSGSSKAMLVTNTNDTGNGWSMKTIQKGSNYKNYYRTVKNGLKYTGTPTSAYTCYSQSTWSITSHYNYINDHYINDTLTNGDPDIDIINYKKLIDALKEAANSSTNKGYLADLQEKYQKGGLEGLFKAFDSATSLDPNTGSTYFNHTYDYAGENVYANESEPMDAAALQCGKDIDSSVALLGNIKITTEDANYDRLVAAIKAYEDKMADMKNTIYTNLTDAYKAYLLACEYRDAYEYGGRQTFENPTLSGAAENLESATDDMISFDERTWNGVGKLTNDAPADSYSNILYCSSTANWNGTNAYNSSFAGAYSNILYRVGMPSNVVLVYNGNNDDLYYPIAYEQKRNSSSNNRTYSMYLDGTLNDGNNTSCAFTLKSEWRGFKSGTNGETNWQYSPNNSDWEYNDQSKTTQLWRVSWESDVKYKNTTKASVTYESDEVRNNTERCYYNRIYFNGSFENNEYSKTQYRTVFKVNSKTASTGREGDKVYSNNTAYVINYYPLYQKLSEIAKDINGIDVTNYQEGGLAAWLAKLDSVASVDPNSFFTNMNDNGVATAVTKCATAIKNAVGVSVSGKTPTDVEDVKTSGDVYNSETGELNSISGSNGAYTNLKIALEEVKTAPASQGCVKSDYWDDYNDKAAAAQLAMYTVANNTGKDANTNKDGYANEGGKYSEEDINAFANDLHNAIEALYDISNSSHPLKFSYQEKGTHDGYFQCYLDNSHILGYDDEHKLTTLSEADMSAWDAAKILYGTLDLTKFKDNGKNIITNALLTFNAVKTAPTDAGQTAQDYVNAGITALLEGVNEASDESSETGGENRVNEFTVNFELYKNGEQVGETLSTTHKYGTVVELDAASSFAALLGTNTCYKWELGNKKLALNSNNVSLYIQQDITIKAYFVEKGSDATYSVDVYNTFLSKFHSVLAAEDAVVSFASANVNDLSVGGSTLSVPNSINFTITGWKVGDTVLEAGKDYTVKELLEITGSDNVRINPVLESKHQDKAYYVKLDGVVYSDENRDAQFYAAVPHDEYAAVTTTVENAYALCIYDGKNYIPVSYVKDGETTASYGFRTIYNMDFYTMTKVDGKYYIKGEQVTDDDFLFHLDNKLPMVYSFADPETSTGSNGVYSKYVNYSAFTTEVNATVTECGTLFSNNTASSKETMTLEGVGSNSVFRQVNSNRDMVTNQYYLTFNSSYTGPVYFRPYVKYNYTYNGNTYSAVSYGEINTAFYNTTEEAYFSNHSGD